METPVPTSADTSERKHSVLRTRREWSVAEKQAIVAETRAPGANISAISRRHGAAQSLIYQWRKMFVVSVSASTFLPVTVTNTPAPSATVSTTKPAVIEIELASGRKLRVTSDIEASALKRIIAALEAA